MLAALINNAPHLIAADAINERPRFVPVADNARAAGRKKKERKERKKKENKEGKRTDSQAGND